MAPTWEQLANSFDNERSVVIARVNAVTPEAKKTALSQGINSFPTIKFFPKGSRAPVLYEGPRTEVAFTEFVNRMAGTRQSVRVKVADANERIDEAVNEIVETMGENAAEEVEAKPEEGRRIARYYNKIAKKIKANAEQLKDKIRQLSVMVTGGNRKGVAPVEEDTDGWHVEVTN